jgi:hypothetical protein
MMRAINAPKRSFELTVRISGDTWEDIIDEFRFLELHLSMHGASCQSVSGGLNRGHIVEIYHDPTMTHEKYIAEVEKFRTAVKAARSKQQ